MSIALFVLALICFAVALWYHRRGSSQEPLVALGVLFVIVGGLLWIFGY